MTETCGFGCLSFLATIRKNMAAHVVPPQQSRSSPLRVFRATSMPVHQPMTAAFFWRRNIRQLLYLSVWSDPMHTQIFPPREVHPIPSRRVIRLQRAPFSYTRLAASSTPLSSSVPVQGPGRGRPDSAEGKNGRADSRFTRVESEAQQARWGPCSEIDIAAITGDVEGPGLL